MTETLFRLQIIDQHGRVVHQFPGGGPLERDLIATITAHVLKHGVGMWRTEAHVARALETGIAEALYDLKRDTVPLVRV